MRRYWEGLQHHGRDSPRISPRFTRRVSQVADGMDGNDLRPSVGNAGKEQSKHELPSDSQLPFIAVLDESPDEAKSFYVVLPRDTSVPRHISDTSVLLTSASIRRNLSWIP
jgi:hypothetical protein